MAYRVEIKPSAERALSRLPREAMQRVDAAILALADAPRPPGVKKLHGTDGDAWRIRVGDYRVVYEIHDDVLSVVVLAIGHRREVYRKR